MAGRRRCQTPRSIFILSRPRDGGTTLSAELLTHAPAPIRRAVYFALQRAIGSRIALTWREFQRWERFTPKQLGSAVEERLSHLLATATAESEYYHELRLERHPAEPAREWLRRFPVLSREKVRENFARLVNNSLRNEIISPQSVARKRYDWLIVKTGGTTGIPT